jgi:hypothetical protein
VAGRIVGLATGLGGSGRIVGFATGLGGSGRIVGLGTGRGIGLGTGLGEATGCGSGFTSGFGGAGLGGSGCGSTRGAGGAVSGSGGGGSPRSGATSGAAWALGSGEVEVRPTSSLIVTSMRSGGVTTGGACGCHSSSATSPAWATIAAAKPMRSSLRSAVAAMAEALWLSA